MPLASFAFTGCVMGHEPSAPGSMNASTFAVSGRLATEVAATDGRGIGGKGNGAESHEISLFEGGCRSFHQRHPAYAIPARIPVRSSRFEPLRIAQFSHGCRADAEVTLT